MAASPPIAAPSASASALDGGTAYSGAVITRYYDPLLEKVTAWAPTPAEAIARMDRALREFRIRGVATNLAFLESDHRRTRASATTTTRPGSSTTTPELFQQVKRRDRATKLLTYIADVTVNGHPEARGRARPPADARGARCRRASTGRRRPPAPSSCSTRSARRHSPRWMREREAGAGHRHDDARRATSRCSRPACARYDIVAHRRRPMRAACRSFCRSNAGAARPSTSPCASSPRTRGSGWR